MFDRINSRRFRTALALYALVYLAATSTAISQQSQPPGKIVVAKAFGKVNAVHPESPSPRRLRSKDTITEKHTVNVGASSSATLVFSNGSIISLLEKSTLAVSKFLQDPFSAPYSIPISTAEPTTSSTKLNLTKGEVVCDVKKLQTNRGSSLTVETPVGAAGVRGTIFAVTFSPNLDGTDKGVYYLSVTEGEVSMTGKGINPILIAAGKELAVSFRSRQDPTTGETVIIEILNQEVRDIPAKRLAKINGIAAAGKEEARIFVFDPTQFNLLDSLQVSDVVPVMVDPLPLTTVNP